MKMEKQQQNGGAKGHYAGSVGFVLAVIASLCLHGLAAIAMIYAAPALAPEKTDTPPKFRMVVVDLMSFQQGASSARKTHSEIRSVAGTESDTARKKPVPRILSKTGRMEETEKARRKSKPVLNEQEKPAVTEQRQTVHIVKTPVFDQLARLASKMASSSENAENTVIARPVKRSGTKTEKRPSEKKPDRPGPVSASRKDPTADRAVKKLPGHQTKKHDRASSSVQKKKSRRKKITLVKKSRDVPAKKRKRAFAKKVRKKGKVGEKKGRRQRHMASRGRAAGRGIRKKGRAKNGRTQGAGYSGAGLSNPRPRYPLEARRRHQQGRVLLRVHVGINGRARSVRISKSSGYGLLDRAAIGAVRRWRFRPAMRNGKAVSATVIVPVSFRLGR